MIFIYFFVTISLTFCNSVFVNKVLKTHLLILSYLELDDFKGNWVGELPNEMIEQRSSICQLLIEPIIIFDSITFPVMNDSVYSYFKDNLPDYLIFPLKEHTDEPFLFEIDNHRIHLLPCQRNSWQTIYITKLVDYESYYIMLAREERGPNNEFELRVLGFIMEFAQLNSFEGNNEENTVKLFYNAFGNSIINNKKEKRNPYPTPVYYHWDATLEYRIQAYRLCASVLRKLIVGRRTARSLPLNVEYLQKDILIGNKTSRRVPFFRLKVIQCESGTLEYDLVKFTSNRLFIIYEINNIQFIELLYEAEDIDTIRLLESAFAYVNN